MTRWLLAALLAALLLGSAAAAPGGGGDGGPGRRNALAPSPAEAPQQQDQQKQEGASPPLGLEPLSPEPRGGGESPSPAPPPTTDGSPALPPPTDGSPAPAPVASSPAPAPADSGPAPVPAAAPISSSSPAPVPAAAPPSSTSGPAPAPRVLAASSNANRDAVSPTLASAPAPPPSDAPNSDNGDVYVAAASAVSPPAQAPLARPPSKQGGSNDYGASPLPQQEPSPSPIVEAPAPPPAGQGGSNALGSPSPSLEPQSPLPSPDPLPPSPAPLSPSPVPAPPPGDFTVTDEDGGKAPSAAVDSPPPFSPSPSPLVSPPPDPSPDPPPSPVLPPPPDANPQAAALLDFKAGLSDSSQDLLEGWNSSTANPCSGWKGVVCDGANENVQGLQLSGLDLTGTISPSLADLPKLQQVDLSDNQLAGVIPKPWQTGDGNAPELQSLLLHNNWMTGPLPALTLRTLGNATLHGNMLTGSIPISWATAPSGASISILPQQAEKQGGGLCGDVPSAPKLTLYAPPGAWYPVVNTLGSCLSSCNNPVTSLTNTNIYQAALDSNATVWDTAAINGWAGQEASAESVTIPCYQQGSPVGGYLGGDQAFMMVAWSNGGSTAASAVVAAKPGDDATTTCGMQGTFWSVDLRYNLTVTQVVIQAGSNGIDDFAVYLDNELLAPGSGTPCGTGISLTSAAATVSCAGITGRYLTLVSGAGTGMSLCSVAVYPEVANAAINRYYYFTTAGGVVQAATNAAGSSHLVEAPDGQTPTFVLNMGSKALVTAVSLALAENLATISVSNSNPLVPAAAPAAPAPAAGRRRLARHAQRALLQGEPSAGVVSCTPGPQPQPNFSYNCAGGTTGQYVIVTGTPGTTLRLDNLAAFLGQPPAPGPSPSPSPAPAAPSPPPVRTFQTMWIGNLLVGGNLDRFQNTSPYSDEVLETYNAAWSNALIQRGYAMDTNASAFTTVEKNVANPTGSPYYYGGTETGPNVFTNTSVSVDSRLSYQRLTELLDTPEVAGAIETNLSGSWGLFDAWMLPYATPAPPPSPSSGGLSTGAIIGIAAGGAAAVVAAAVALFCCVCRGDRRRARQDTGTSKGSLEAGDAAQSMELGGLRQQYPPPALPGGKGGSASTQQLADARKLYAEQQRQEGDPAVPYGSAYANGGGSGGAAQHSHHPSADSSGMLGGGGALSSSEGAGASGSGGPIADDPLLEWILRTQSNTPQHAGRSAAMAAAAATAAATAAAAGDATVLVEAPRDGGAAPGGSGSARGTPKHSRSGSKALMDVRVWQFDFRDLEIQKQIGEGGFGRVYLAKWRETLVAVKVLLNTGVDIEDVDDAERALTLSNPVLEDLQKEASMMAALRHPNVVAFLGVCVNPPSVATEYCARGSLTDVLRGGRANAAKAKQLDWARRINMALDAAKGMLYLHEHSPPIIHRDLKSPNLLVDKHWRVKVSDFNLSKIMEENSVMSSLAATNPRWLAPEILSGGKATLASDVWAFGIVMWEMLTWDLPWGNTNPWQVVQIVGEGGRLEIPPRERLPGPDSATWQELDAYLALLDRCCAQTPAARPKFQEIIVVLRDMLERTLAAKGVIAGSGGAGVSAGASPGGTPFTDSLLRGAASASTAATARGGRGGGGLAPATSNASSLAAARGVSTPASPVAGGDLTLGALSAHDSEADTPMSAAAYGSTLAELGSVGTLSPLGSQSGGGNGGRNA